ncbi:MAG TPA: hypothetical protein VFE24_14120, partial [Pirellulales bacterium]|nr:hypothetical protein [Pirellulales bacterium]
MAADPSSPPLAQEIRGLLARVRTRIRRYIWLEGLALAILWLGVAFWVTLGFDWLFEPPPMVRAVVLGAVLIGFGYVLYRYLLRRAFVRFTDESMAVALERRFHHFGDSLLTSVTLTEQPTPDVHYNPEMLSHTRELAKEAAGRARPGQVFRWGPLGQRLLGAAVLVGSIAAFAVFVPDAFATWFGRSIELSETPWPRRTHLVVDGFDDAHPAVKIGKGGEFTVNVKAELPSESNPDRIVPELVKIRYASEDGNRNSESMTREGEAVAPRDKFQNFKYSFQNVMAPVRFYAVGGDDRTREYQIDVVENPVIVDMRLTCDYPDYFHKAPEKDVSVSGVMQRPQGSKLTLHARCNKELVKVAVDRLDGQKIVPLAPLEMVGATDRKAFDYVLDKFTDDQTLQFTLYDTDGIHTREPYRLTLTAKPDEAPQLTVRLRGIGTAITPKARLPVQGEITDDVGLARIWFDYQIDKNDPVEKPFQRTMKDLAGHDYEKLTFKTQRRETLIGIDAFERPQPELPAFKEFVKQHTRPGEKPDIAMLWSRFHPPEEALDASELSLKVGQKLAVAIKAADYCDLQEKPNVGAGERYELDVVTEQQLRSILEGRELKLRRQFETIIGDVTDTHDSLVRIDMRRAVDPTPGDKPGAEPEDTLKKPADKKDADKKDADKKDADKKDADGKPVEAKGLDAKSAGSEPGDTERKPVSQTAIRLLRTRRAIENGQRSAHELQSLALDFDDIREELVNNRLDTTEGIRTRLQDKIILPLQSISEKSFPELERRLR